MLGRWNQHSAVSQLFCYHCSVAQLCPTLCSPLDYNTPGFPVPHRLLELAQVQVHCISDAIQPSHLLMPSSPSSLIFTQISDFSDESTICISSVHFSRSVMSNSLQFHGLQHTRPLCPSLSPEVFPSSCPLHQWCHPAIASSDALFSLCPQSFPALGTFPMSQMFASDDQNTGASASALPRSIQCWFPLRLTRFIPLISKGLSGVFSSTTVWRHQFFGSLPSFQSRSHDCKHPLGRP